MKIIVIGVGAMGSIFAGLLADAGNDVWAVDVWQEHIDAIRAKGLRIEGASGDRIVTSVNAVTDVSEAGAADLFIIATKASGVGPAARAIAPYVHPDALVLTIQNGLGSGERIAEHMATGNVLLGVAGGFGASVKGPGHVHHNSMQLIRVGEMNGGLTSRLERVAEVWRKAGFNVQAYEDIDQLIWEKFLCNVAFSGPCTVFDRTIGEVMDDPDRWKVALGCMLEAYQTGVAKNINFSFKDPVEYVTRFGRNMPHAKPSMLQDHYAKRLSEIDAINGMVPVLGAQHGLATPYNDTIVATVKTREQDFSK